MTTASLRARLALSGAVLASVLLVAPSAAAPAPAGACTDAVGVTVIVDFGEAGGGVQTRCAPGPVTSGFDALTRAGFSVTNVTGQPFLCRIDGQPADDPCNHTPSASRYWSFWHAERGEPWTYSTSGASRTPPAGSVDGWAFGAGEPPRVPPPGPAATTTTTSHAATTATTSAAGGAPPPSGPSTDATSSSRPPDAASPTSAPARTAGTGSTTSSPTGSSSVDGAVVGGPALDVVERTPAGTDSGSPAGVAVAAVAVGVLGAGGIRTARRRRNHGSAG